ncbi:hypothetical protein [Psychromonas ossibalaenae]|uniref:hypothetical protein n=1 Tax=Psychromonas ossibalaenae TaxID=444922 RepID=UPI00037C560A|nr:hypothetical protein [Psychromonas ossibalaenae]
MKFKQLTALTCCFYLSGCAYFSSPTYSVEEGIITTADVTITALDNSYKLTSGERFEIPLQSGIGGPVDELKSSAGKLLTEHQGTKVRVSLADKNLELYGLLTFYEINNSADCRGLATTSHTLIIPKKVIKQALSGETAVVYDYYTCAGTDTETTSWVLWLSKEPF